MVVKGNSIFGYPRAKALSIIALGASLLSVTSIFSIPIPFSPVPITLQVLTVYLVTAIEGPIFGTFSCIIYLLFGAVGLPVYAGASSGPAVLIGPTGGYLLGFPAASLTGGLICRKRTKSKSIDLVRVCVACLVELSVIYLVGSLWLGSYLHLNLYGSLLVGAVPFIPVDALKAVVAVPIAMRIRWLRVYLPISPNSSQSSSAANVQG